MKTLEYKDKNGNQKLIPLEGYKNVTFPLSGDMKQEATLFTRNNQIARIPGSDFKIIDEK